MQSFAQILTALFVLFVLPGNLFAQNVKVEPSPVILAVHPYLPYEELQTRFKPLASYIEEVLGQPVVVRIGPDYREHMNFIGMNKVDIAFMGPALYVRLIKEYGQKPLLARLVVNGLPEFNGYLVTTADNPITEIHELKGKSFAFGDPASTMSHLVPRYMLLEAGVKTTDLKNYQFLGSHINVAIGVLSGAFDAGAVKEEVLETYKSQGLRAFAKSEPISEHLFVARSDASPEFIERIRKALYGLSETAEGRKILHHIKPTVNALAPVADEDYDNLRKVLDSLSVEGLK